MLFSVRTLRLRSTVSGSTRTGMRLLPVARVLLLIGLEKTLGLGLVTLGELGQDPGGAKLMFLLGGLPKGCPKVFVLCNKSLLLWAPDDAKCSLFKSNVISNF